MDKPNPASVFGRRQSPRTPESPATPSAAYEQRGSNTREIAKDDEVAKARSVAERVREEVLAKYGDDFKDGAPMLGDSLSEDEILELVAEEWVLPDGRPIGLRDYWSGNTMDIAEQQRRIIRARAERAEWEDQEHKRRVEGAIRYFERGYSLEQVTGSFGSKASNEAKVLYETGLVEREATERAEQERKRLEAAEAAARQEPAMAQFEEVTALPTIEQIEATVQKNGGLIRSYGYGFDMPRQEGRVGPWRVAVVDRRGMGNHGWVIAIAMTRDAFARQKKTTIDRHRLWAKPIRKR